MPKYLELEGEIVIDISSILGQEKKTEKPKDKNEEVLKDLKEE